MSQPPSPVIHNLASLFQWRCRRNPNDLAYAFVRDNLVVESQVTFGQLERRVYSLAIHLAREAPSGTRALLLYPQGLDVVYAFWACACAGLVPVPTPTPDLVRQKHSLPRLRSIIDDAQALLALTTSDIKAQASELSIAKEISQIKWVATDHPYEQAHSDELPRSTNTALAYLQYTSGSTATPRGVMISHGNVISHCRALSLVGEVSDSSRSLCWLPYFHDYGLLHGIIAPFYTGNPAYLMSPVTFLRRPLRWLEAVARFGITHSGGPNFSYEACLRAVRQQEGWQADLSKWVVASCGAEPIHPDTVERFIDTFGPYGFRRTTFAPGYGLAEATLSVTVKRAGTEPSFLHVDADALADSIVKESPRSERGTRTLVGCGVPLEETHVRIVNPTTRRECPPCVVGEVWLAGSGIAAGYWEKPEESEAVFKATLAGSNEGPYLRTGDLGFIHRGELFLTGRLKDLIIVRGRNYYPHDLEWTAQQAHFGLRRGSGAAFSIEGKTGELVVLVHEIDRQVSESDLPDVMNCIRRALADEYGLELHSMVLIKSGTIPRTSSGKIQRSACRAALESSQLAVVAASTLDLADAEPDELRSEPPQTTIEKKLADIWQEVLAGPAPHRHANFFALGGNSLLAAQVVARILDAFHVEFPLSVLFEFPTLSTLAARIGEPNTSPADADQPEDRSGYASGDGRTRIPVVPLPSAFTREGRIPLSPSQQRLRFLEQVHPGSAINHISMAVRIRGSVNPDVLERSVQEIIRRHEILRTRFGSEKGEGFAAISPEGCFTLAEHDFKTLSRTEQEIEVRQFLRTEASRPFDLGQGPLFRVALLALDQDLHVLGLTFHRLVADGWSLRLFCKELALLMEAGGNAQEARLSTPYIQYTNYVNWHRTRLDRGLREVDREYWIKQLRDVPPPAELPADRPRPRVRAFEGAAHSRSLSPSLTNLLSLFCRQQSVTRFMVLYAVFVTWLQRYTHESDVVTGSIVSARRRKELEDVMGYCVNTVALRSELSDGLTVHELLEQIRRVVVEAYDHQDLPFEEVIEALSLQRGHQLFPLFNVMIVGEDDPLSTFSVSDLEVTHLPWEPTASEFDLVLMVVNKVQGLELAVLYDRMLFDESTIILMLGQIEMLLEQFIEKPDSPLDTLSLLTAQEREHLLTKWNRPSLPVPHPCGIHQLIEAQVKRTPHAPAVTCGDKSISYQELNERANRVARALKKLGVDADHPVGLCIERSVDALVGLLGILKAGGGYVPLDPSFPAHRLQLILDDANVSIVVTQERLHSHLQGYAGQICDVETLCHPPTSGNEENLAISTSPDQLAYIIYTSGSIGRPKGVAVTHRNVVTSLQARLHYYSESVDQFLLTFSLAFDGSVTGIFWTLSQGGELVIPSEIAHRDPTELASLIALHHISHVVWVPSLYHAVLGEALGTQLDSLRIVITAGESLPLELVRRHYQLLPHTTLYNEYGPAETTGWCSVYQTTREEAGARVPIGKPINHMQLYVLDAKLQPMPIGVPGELYVSGDCLARGYVNQPQLTQKRFLANPHVVGTRLYRTGDLARYRADGNVEFLGWMDQQIKLRGYRIEPGEIESVLSNFPGVHHTAVLLRQDKGDQHRLVGYIVGESSLKGRLEQVRRYLATRLPHYMVPSVILCLDSMPLNATGKVNCSALPAPDDTTTRAVSRVAPRNQVEESLAELWKSVLQVPEVGIHDNFFEQGGHSLLATQLVSRIRELFEVDISLPALFARPTIAALAEEVTRLRQEEKASMMPSIVPVPRDQPLPLSYSQQRMWLMHQLAPQSTAYNMPFASRQMGRLNKVALRNTIDAICRRHEAFRTTFMMSGDGPVQMIHPFRPPHWVETDLQQLPREQRRQQAARLVEQEANQPFDLEQGPLARFLLIEIEPEDHVLVLTMHHIIGDQWSFGIIGREFAFFYNAFSRGEIPSPKPIPIQYADYAVWQRRCLTDDWLSIQSDYWQKKLAGLSKLSLPTDHPRPALQTFNGSHRMLELPSSLIERLKQFSADHNATVFMTLLACFQILLSRYSSQTDLAVGSPIANRTQSAVEAIIGSFVNTLVLRTDLSGNPTFVELMARVRETALEAYAHQDFPFDKLVETMHSSRDNSSAPLVQVLFNVPNAPIGEINVQGLSWVPFEAETHAAQFDLSLTIETEISRKAYLSFNTDLFEAHTAERMLQQYKTLLQSALANPQNKLSELPTVTAFERRQMLQDWNRTQREYPQSACFPQLFEAQVDRMPDAVALSMGQKTLRYSQLNTQANQLARYLQTQGARPGAAVGIGLERSVEMVIALLAVLKTGAAYVPLDPDYPRDRLRFMSENASLIAVLTSASLSDRFDAQVCRTLCLDQEQERIAQEPDHNLPPTATPQDLAYILYTSGSTGQPKGVEIPHRALVNFLWSIRQEPGCSAQDVMLSVTTLSFDIAGLELYVPLLVGARVEIATRAVAMDGRQLRALCEAVQPTIMQATPATWRMLVEAGWQGSTRLTILCGGEPLPPDLAVTLLDRSETLWNMYGPTETTIWSTIERIERNDQDITIGRPIANTDVYILDQFLQPVPVGVAGELYIGGLGLARGYRGRPELTEERFIPHPFSAEPLARLYRTGDLARYRPDGRIVHLGRLDHQVKIRGYRIELGEIETALSRHQAVRQAVVMAREDQHGVKQLVAYVVCQDGPAPNQPELRSFLRSEIPDYMVPSLFVFLDAMPLTANNKVDRNALPAPVSTLTSDAAFVAPSDRMDIQMAVLWQQVFGVDQVGIHDNFFDLGGHSLKAAHLFYLIEQVYGRHLPLSTLFQAPTIATLTSVLTQEQWALPWQSLVVMQPNGSGIPVFLVPGVGGDVLWFANLARLLGRANPVYGLQARGFDGKEDPFLSVPEMAKHYVTEIRRCLPQGPYVLVGACTGGLVAYEMAQQLGEQNTVAILIILNSWHPTSYHTRHSDLSLRFALPLRILSMTTSTLDELHRTPMKDWLLIMHRKYEKVRSAFRKPTDDELRQRQLKRIQQAMFRSAASYTLHTYPGRILNIVASQRIADHDTRYGWGKLAGDGSLTIEVAVRRTADLLASPHVESVSSHIRRFIDDESQDSSVRPVNRAA
ncbi:MAG: amino acid adenylation domain-containing protein [Nitrospira sp.]|nr:amino acid adenylation domain-containing protein [Nitrospira sp.]MDH5496111.1 amino acid adenylation domain-containing protein [Nitrospira sp.]